MRPRSANIVTVLALAGLMGGIALTAPRWMQWLSEPRLLEDEPTTAVGGSEPADGQKEARRTISVRIFFVSEETGGLVPEEREVEFSSELASQVRNVVSLLLLGSNTGLVAPFPEGVRVLEVFLTARGVAYVSLSPEAAGIEGGTTTELLAVYSLVDTIVANFASIKRVQVLVGDRMVDTLAGHVDLSRPLGPDFTLLVVPTPSPSPPATDETTMAPSPQSDGPAPSSAGPSSPPPANDGATLAPRRAE
jgi:hypothetical protein